MARRLVVLLIVAVAALAGAGLPAAPAVAQTDGPRRVTPVWPGVERQEWSFTNSADNPVAAQVLVVDQGPSLRVRPLLAQDRVPGLETVPSMGRRHLSRGAVAGINGGFWLFQPVGDPNSYMAMEGHLVSEAETQGGTGRGTVGMTADGQALIDQIDTDVTLLSRTRQITVDGVNRTDRGGPYPDSDDAIYVFNHAYGDSVALPGPEVGTEGYRGRATVLSIPDMRLPASGTGNDGVVPQVEFVTGGSVPIPDGGLLVVGYGEGGNDLADLQAGERVYASVQITTFDRDRDLEWARVAEGLAAGPLILRAGEATDEDDWGGEGEGFSPGHTNCCGPRSAIGVTAEGKLLLVTVDGREPDHSVGMSMRTLADYLKGLGAVDAISLDGGGSTTMTVDGLVRNRPSDGRARPVASGLFVLHDYDFTATERLSGSGRAETAAAVALAAYPDGAEEVLLASGGDFPDALSGGPLASTVGAPLLLTGRDALTPVTETTLRQLGARRVTVLGGSGVVSDKLEVELTEAGYDVRRLSGAGRFETAAAIAESLGGGHERIVLASGQRFPDALSVASPAGMLGVPIVLTASDVLPSATEQAIVRSGASEVVIVGGAGVVSPAVEQAVRRLPTRPAVTRLGGTTRFGTARAVNTWAAGLLDDLDQAGLVIADGANFPDALAGGPLAASRRQLLMIVPGPDVNAQADAAAYLEERAAGPLERVTLLGGHGVLSSYQQLQLDTYALR